MTAVTTTCRLPFNNALTLYRNLRQQNPMKNYVIIQRGQQCRSTTQLYAVIEKIDNILSRFIRWVASFFNDGSKYYSIKEGKTTETIGDEEVSSMELQEAEHPQITANNIFATYVFNTPLSNSAEELGAHLKNLTVRAEQSEKAAKAATSAEAQAELDKKLATAKSGNPQE